MKGVRIDQNVLISTTFKCLDICFQLLDILNGQATKLKFKI